MRNILLSSSGSKVALAQIARRAARKRGVALHATDIRSNVPTIHFADTFQEVPSENSADSLLQYCIVKKIGLVIPSRHGELQTLAKAKREFAENGVDIAISSQETIELSVEKLKTHEFFQKNGIPTPKTFPLETDTSELVVPQLPLIAKPVAGSGSAGVQTLSDIETYAELADAGGFLAQSIAPGDEFTINAYASRNGQCLCAIPHQRLVVDGGESVQAVTRRIPTLVDLAHAIVNALPDPWGPITIQAFLDPDTGDAQAIEINPRVGGAYALSDQAKGRYIEWLARESLDRQTLEPFDDWTDGLRMMRYREAVFDYPAESKLS